MSKDKDEKAVDVRPTKYDPFGLDTEIIQADWWPEWMTVTVRELTFDESESLMKLGLRGDAELPRNRKGRRRSNFKVRDTTVDLLRKASLRIGIVSWTWESKDGKPLPISDETLGKMRAKDSDFIMEALDRLNPETDEEFQDGD